MAGRACDEFVGDRWLVGRLSRTLYGQLPGTKKEILMAFSHVNKKGQTYFLHGKMVTLRGGREQKIHYFAKEAKPGEVLPALPDGYEVVENERTGLPFIRKHVAK